MSPTDRLARIRYVLRHWPADKMCSEIEIQMAELRRYYRSNPKFFSPQDIKFLQSTKDSIDTILELENLRKPLEIIKNQEKYLADLSEVSKKMESFAVDPTFSALSKRAKDLLSQFLSNTATKRKAKVKRMRPEEHIPF